MSDLNNSENHRDANQLPIVYLGGIVDQQGDEILLTIKGIVPPSATLKVQHYSHVDYMKRRLDNQGRIGVCIERGMCVPSWYQIMDSRARRRYRNRWQKLWVGGFIGFIGHVISVAVVLL